MHTPTLAGLSVPTLDKLFDVVALPLQQLTLPVWVTIALVIVVSIVTYFTWYKKWKKRRDEARLAAGGRRELSKGALVAVWKKFLGQIPTEFRRAILSYPPVVVLGEAGSGKSVLIGKYTDWKGQAAQFYPSFSQDPQLQIYLGSRTVVQEVPSALLYDYSQSARAALVRLWKPQFRFRDPVVVLAISANALKTATPDALRTLAQTFRGKINVLSRIREKPVMCRIVVTHMDQVEGYLAFSQFLDKMGVQLKLDISAGDAQIESCLEPYEKYLPLALTQLPAKAYMKVVTFLQKAPATLALLSVLLKTLRENDPLSYGPEIKDLYLTSDTAGSTTALSNPFASAYTGQGILAAAATRTRHRMFASTAALAGLGVLTYGYFSERAVWVETQDALARFNRAHEARWIRAVDQKLGELAGEESQGVASVLVPRVFGGTVDRSRDHFAATLRAQFLLPALERAQNSKGAHGASLYALGTLYASRDGEVGKFVLDHSAEIARTLDLPEAVVTAYVRNSRKAWAEPVTLPHMPFDHKLSAANDLQPWLSYFIELQQAYDGKAYLTTSDLEKLQSTAQSLLASVEEVRKYDAAQTIFAKLVAAQVAVDVRTAFEPWIQDLQIPDWIKQNYATAEGLFEMVAATRISVPPVETASLPEFIYHMRGISASSDRPGPNYRFQLSGKIFTFEGERWQKLLEAGRVRMLIQNFVDGHKGSIDKLLLADDGKGFKPVVMKPENRGDYIFQGKGAIEGPYTRAAYDREVKPVLLQFAGVVEALKDTPDLQASLVAFVERACEKYATAYEQQAGAYYDAWEVHPINASGLMLILEQMKLPASPLTEMLDTVRDTTGFVAGAEEKSSPYLRIITEKLAHFQYPNKLVSPEQQQEGGLTSIKEYQKIVARMYQDLELQHAALTAAAKPEEKKEAQAGDAAKAPEEFTDSLEPEGRAALAILRNDRESYRRNIEGWLTTVGIEGSWKRPFLAPVNELYALGLVNLEQAVRKNWYSRVSAQLTTILGKYPFNPKGEIEALPREVEATLHPNGTFWKAWRTYVAPVCVEEDGVWRASPALDARFRWPKEMFTIVNHLSKLTRALYDKSGTPKAFIVEVKPRDLPTAGDEEPAVILSFIGSGKNSVFGFNQKPAWQKLEWEWWSGQQADAGAQLEDRASEDKFYKQTTVQDSMWGLLRLLKQAQELETNVWTFQVGSAASGTAKIKFEYKQDPWDLFSIPSTDLLIEGGKNDEAVSAIAPGGKNRAAK